MGRLSSKPVMVAAVLVAGAGVVRMFRGGPARAFEAGPTPPSVAPLPSPPWPPLEPLDDSAAIVP